MAEYIIQSLDRNDFINFINVWQQKEYKISQDALYIGVCFNDKSKVGITQSRRIKKREKEWKAIFEIEFVKVWVTDKIQTIFLEQFIHKLFTSLGLHHVCNESKEVFNVEPEHCIKVIEIIMYIMEKTNFNKISFVKMLFELKVNKILNEVQIENKSTINIHKTCYKTVPSANKPIPLIFGESQMKSWNIEKPPKKIINNDIIIEVLPCDPNKKVYITRTGKYYHKETKCGDYNINIESTVANAINKNFKKCIYCFNEPKLLTFEQPKQSDICIPISPVNNDTKTSPLLNNTTRPPIGILRRFINCVFNIIPSCIKKFFRRFVCCCL
jgi:hypothetical protein